jgi:hypothetical protein
MSETGDSSTFAGGLQKVGDVSHAALWSFGPEGFEILVRDADILLAHLPLFLTGWPFKRIVANAGKSADIDVVQQDDGKILIARHGIGADQQVFDEEFSAANGLASALVVAYIALQEDKVCFHAGSAQLGSGLVVLLGDSFAGKSSVALHLASAGYRLFGDDRLAVSLDADGVPFGHCLGLSPKIRLPLPADCGPRFEEYIDSFTEIRDDGAAYLKLWEGEAANFLESAPVSAFVILERSDAGPCTVSPKTRPEIAKALIETCFSPNIDTRSLVPAMTQMAANARGLALKFSSSREAAALLTKTIRGGEGDAGHG